MSRATSPGFPSTHWSKVALAGRPDGEAQREALGELLRLYIKPLRAYLRINWRLGADDADDALQGFFAGKVMEEELIGRADRLRGKFRTFLLSALDRHVADQFRRQRALKRGADLTVPLEGAGEVPDSAPPAGDLFDVDWARSVLAQALDGMRCECKRSGRDDMWGVFEGRVLHVTLDHADPTPYPELARRFGLESPAQASNVLATAKRMFTRHLRATIGRYELDESRIDEEVAELRAILARNRR